MKEEKTILGGGFKRHVKYPTYIKREEDVHLIMGLEDEATNWKEKDYFKKKKKEKEVCKFGERRGRNSNRASVDIERRKEGIYGPAWWMQLSWHDW